MAERVVRINELVKREISAVLHTRFQNETVMVTISEVVVEPNLRTARVFYSVLGGEAASIKAAHFFTKFHGEIRRLMGQKIVLKFLPHLQFIEDNSTERGVRVNQLLDDLGLREDFTRGKDKP